MSPAGRGLRVSALVQGVLGWALAGVGAIMLVQVLVAAAPGDAIDTLPDPALRARLAAEWGLDQPLGVRVLAGTARALSGAWGTSWTVRPGAEVGGLVASALTASLPMIGCAWVLAVGLGHAARGRAAWSTALSGLSTLPVVLLAIAAIEGVNAAVWRGMEAGWWGRPAFFALPVEGGLVRDLLLIGVLGLGSATLAEVATRARGADARLGEAGFVLAARARGAGPAELASTLWRHRVVPLAEAAQATFSPLLGGLVVVERLFARPGLGDLLWRAVGARDVPVATAAIVSFTAMTVAVGAALEVLRRLWDPRLRVGG